MRRWGCCRRRGWAAEPQPVSFALCTVSLWMHSSRWPPPICAPCEASSLHSPVRRPPPHRAPPRCAWPPRPRPPTRAARASSKAPPPRTCWCPLDRSKTSSIRHTSTSRCPLPRLEFTGRSSPSPCRRLKFPHQPPLTSWLARCLLRPLNPYPAHPGRSRPWPAWPALAFRYASHPPARPPARLQ